MEAESGPIALFALIRTHHQNESWRRINPVYSDTLRLALHSRMEWRVGDFAEIAKNYNAHYWLGESIEPWYSQAILGAHPSAVLSMEKWMGRDPFLVDGERIYVGRTFAWEEKQWTCTSIERDFFRAKRTGFEWENGVKDGKLVEVPATLIQIPREGVEEKLRDDREKARKEAEAEKEASRPDPVQLLPLRDHLDQEIRHHAKGNAWGRGTHICTLPAWVDEIGTDYRKAWLSDLTPHEMAQYLRWIGLTKTWVAGTPEEIRKRYSWPKILAQIYRFVREARGLPLKDPPAQEIAP